MAKSIAVVQSCYIPWKGYFDLINRVDEFVLYDDAQYTRRDWRNRNRIKTRSGTEWLTIPVSVKGRYLQRIDETEVSDPRWAQRHWRSLVHAYGSTPHFGRYASMLEDLYLGCTEKSLSAVNRRFLEAICRLLGIGTTLSWSSEYEVEGARTERLVNLCLAAGASAYLSGPSAREYLDESAFRHHGIEVSFMDYSGYPVYEQIHPPFRHDVTVLDLLFHVGATAPQYMKSFAAAPA